MIQNIPAPLPLPEQSETAPTTTPVIKQSRGRVTIEAKYIATSFDWGTTVLASFELTTGDGDITIKCPVDPEDSLGQLEYGMVYRLYGKWSDHPKYGRQFHATDWTRLRPQGREAIVNYLVRQAKIGRKTAEIIHGLFGKNCLSELRSDPAAVSVEVLAANSHTRFTAERAEEAAKELAKDAEVESAAIELIDLFVGRGFPKNLHRRVVAKYGLKSLEVITRNPYLLGQFDGVGFKSADKLYLDLGGDRNRLKRQALCCWYLIEYDAAGHTWLSRDEIKARLRSMVDAVKLDVDRALELAIRAKMVEEYRDCAQCEGVGKVNVLVQSDDGTLKKTPQPCLFCNGTGGSRYFSSIDRARNEQFIAEKLVNQNCDESNWGEWLDESKLNGLTDHQRTELLKALVSRICVFGGIPGTGKTYTMARLVNAIVDAVGLENILLFAPTGKAAVRMTENLQAYGIDLKARTMHSCLGLVATPQGIGWEFNEGNPFDATVFIGDEQSMVDTDLFASFLRAVPRDGHVLLIGDINQLPPVGHGSPLRDLLKAGTAACELEEIQRQKEPGLAVRACDLIRRGKMFPYVDWKEVEIGGEKNLGLYAADDAESAAKGVVEILKHCKVSGVDPIWECQVIVAVNKKGKLCRIEINKQLQGVLNPNGYGEKGTPFRAGDKIVCLKNGDVPRADVDGESVRIANGEIGRVREAKATITFAEFDLPRRSVKIPRGKQDSGSDGGGKGGRDSGDDGNESGAGCNFDLAYGVTCHKMQGSQAKVIIVVLDELAVQSIGCREWIYTAISRMEAACFLVGKRSTAEAMIKKVSLHKRRTFLVERVKAAQKRLVIERINQEVI